MKPAKTKVPVVASMPKVSTPVCTITMDKLQEELVSFCNGYLPVREHLSVSQKDLDEQIVQACDFDDIKSDLPLIQCDRENSEVSGFQTAPCGMPYFMYKFAGDWEEEYVTGIIYYDGSELKRYTPYEGNLYNHLSMEAYGNDHDLDKKDRKEQRQRVLKLTSDWVDLKEGNSRDIERWCETQMDIDINNYLSSVLHAYAKSKLSTIVGTNTPSPAVPSPDVITKKIEVVYIPMDMDCELPEIK